MSDKQVIGIGGVSCSGKTKVAKALQKKLGPDVEILSFDKYYISTEELADKSISWESPYHFRYNQYISDLKKLKNELNGLVIVEGFLIFFDQKARDCFDKKIFIDLPEEEIKRRRIARKRGTESDTISYINNELIPGHRKFVYPQKKYADLVLDGMKSSEELVKEIIDYIKEGKH